MFLVNLLVSVGFSQETENRIEIESDEGMHIDADKKMATFKGSVFLKRGKMTLQCDYLEIHYTEKDKKQEVSELKGSGKVIIYFPERKIKAYADLFIYDSISGEIELLSASKVKVHQEGNILEGKKIRLNVNTGDIYSYQKTKIQLNLNDFKKE